MTEISNSNLSKQWNISYLMIFFVVIFVSDDTFTFGTNQNAGFIAFKYIIYLLLTIYLFFKIKAGIFVVLTRANLVLMLLFFSIMVTAVFNLDITGGYIYQIWIALMAFLITQYMPPKELVRVFIKYIYVLSFISIIVYIIAIGFPILLSPFPVFANSNDVQFYNLLVCVVFKDVMEVRNTGIFREPGVFMIYLSVAVMFELFYKDKMNKKHLVVIIIALFLTFSTAAFIILGVICIAYLFKANNSGVLYNKLFIVFAGVVVIIVMLLSSDIYSRVFDKIGKDSVNDGSALARGASVVVNLKIFSDYPVKGIGISNFPTGFSAYSLMIFNSSFESGNNTNTITTILAIYGLTFGIIFLYMVFSLTRKISHSVIINILLFIAFLMMFSNEDLRYSIGSFVLLFWGLRSDSAKKIIRTKYLERGVNYV